MTGRAYNPKGYEPDLHGGLQPTPKEALEAYQRVMPQALKGWLTERHSYDEAMEYLKRGEGEVLGHYVYEMMYDIYAGIEDEILDGAIDTHLHIYPDYVPRTTDIVQLAIDASRVGYRAICCKDHFFTNVGMAWAAQERCEEMVRNGELENACQVLGTHILAWSHHPDQVNLIRKYPNLGGIFFNTMTSHGGCGPDLPILDDNGELMPEVKECIERMARYKICVFTGHRTFAEHVAMVKYTHEVGGHILLTHSGGMAWGPEVDVASCGTIEQAKELVRLGAFIEVSLHMFVGAAAIWPFSDPPTLVNWLKDMNSPEHIVMSTDLGQPTALHPIEGYRVAIRMLLHAGISKEDLKTMFQKSAIDALYLDE